MASLRDQSSFSGPNDGVQLGQNNGTFQIDSISFHSHHYHLHGECGPQNSRGEPTVPTSRRSQDLSVRASPPRSQRPFYMVPFAQDELFVDRKDIFDRISSKVALLQRRIALSGFAGVG
jgi:hypothetical protein